MFSAFYLIFGSCTRAKSLKEGIPIAEIPNIMDSPLEATIRLFIMTIGEFTVLYRELNGCAENLMQVIGKVHRKVCSINSFSFSKKCCETKDQISKIL